VTRPASGAFATQGGSEDGMGSDGDAGRYRRLDRLGAGGMGVVWRARDTWLERDVALKTVAQRDEHLEQRLDREWRVATRLRSDGCIQILDRGTLDDGRPFIVTELLTTPAFDPDAPLADRLAVLVQVCRTLGDAHQQGIVHRDLKPSNLGLRPGREIRAVVFDWGLAKPIDQEGWSDRVLGPPLTVSGMVTGTVGYMAPEQLANGSVRPASDVWSLAAMLHELLTGRSPCTDGSHTLLAAISKGALDLPDPTFEPLLRRALSLEPEDRPPNGHALADAIEALLAPPPPAPSRRFPATWALGGAGLLAALLGVGTLWSSDPEPSDPTARYDLHVELGQLLAAQGRFAEAHDNGSVASSLHASPDARGLQLYPAAPEPVVVDRVCDAVTTAPALRTWACRSATQVDVWSPSGARTHRVVAEEAWPVDEGLVVRRGWDLLWLRDDGSEQNLGTEKGMHEVIGMGADTIAHTTGPMLFLTRGGQRVAAVVAPHHIDTLVRVVDRVLVTAEEAIFVHEDGALRELARSDAQPVVAAAHVGPVVIFVGLRGSVIELDATTLETVDRYRLRGVDQVEHAAIDRQRIAITTEAGVFVFQRGEPELQVSEEPVDALMWSGPDALFGMRGDTELTWSLGTEWTLMVANRHSTTALRTGRAPSVRAHPSFAAGQRVFKFEPESLAWSEIPEARSNDGVIRSLGTPFFAVENRHAYRLDEAGNRTDLGVFPVLAALDDERAIGVRRWGRGFAVFTPEGDRAVSDAPALRNVVPEASGTHALAVSDEGTVYRLGLDGSVERLPINGVGEILAHGGLGLAVTRGDAIELHGRWTTRCADTITAVAVGDTRVVVGTHSGTVCLLDADGTLTHRFRAHPERVSALGIWGPYLFTGSWAPGVRRWVLPD
jgi:serine/threonine-protein kinase